ncbi:Mss4-like protein [Cladorrhinum samala]|uniref:Mss4-like protein n=1 Tax=Cladorrhinum samala TaxID=585594 RepID=A0AAV9HST7_9PEZI|nr:Mss4-like protein [Cladorrhinum samala]
MSAPTTKNPDLGFPISCQCGYISLVTPPRSLLGGMAHCHCTSCRKQSASAFGTSIYFPTSSVFPLDPELESRLSLYEHAQTESGNTMRCYFCPRCGVRVLHAAVKPDGEMREMVSFKAGLVDGDEKEGLDWKGMKAKHIFTGSAVIKLEEGWECYDKYPPPPQASAENVKQVGGDDE